MDLDERFKKLQQELDAKTADIEQQLEEKLSQVGEKLGQGSQGSETADVGKPSGAGRVRFDADRPRNLRIDMSSERSLHALDDLMEEHFEVRRYLGGSMSFYPTTYCETVREYIEPILADMPMSDAQREAVLEEMEAHAQGAMVPGILGSLGVHIPGIGCFINGWYMGRDAGVAPREVFDSPEGYARIVTTASHEKWGHGFITELTALGREKKSVQLGMHHLADEFDIKTTDTPEHARLSEQWGILFASSQYVEEGFATWIERYLAERVAEADHGSEGVLRNAPTFTVEDIVKRLRETEGGDQAAEAIRALFSQEVPAFESVHECLGAAIQAVSAMGEAFAHAVGMPGPYALGYCLVDAIAHRHGPRCVPYAVATACNIEYGLKTISNHDLANYVATHPELNVNTRLAAMIWVSKGTQDDVGGFLGRVRDELGFAPAIEI